MTAESKYKDQLFRAVFEDKEDLLSLYNALNETTHSNADDINLNTMRDLLYLEMENDISFILDPYLSLYEHQSTYNPNMPLRDLFYVSRLLQAITKDEDLYGSRLIKIPAPRFVVLYNGEREIDEDFEIKLSEAFKVEDKRPCLELVVRVLNINPGHNPKIMNACRQLDEYSRFVGLVRYHRKRNGNLEEAITAAISEAIERGILVELLTRRRAEVSEWITYAYDAEKHIKSEKEISFEEGMSQGMSQGISQGRIETLIECVCDGFMSVSVAAQRCGMSEASFIDEMRAAGRNIPETALA